MSAQTLTSSAEPKLAFTLTFTSDKRTDAEGRRQFFLGWVDGTKKRGQCFFANPDEHIKDLRGRGHSVVVFP